MMAGCEHVREALGVYVLGAIDPTERALVDQHLAVCRECRDELAGLADLPALLGRVIPGEAERAAGISPPAAPPPDRLLDSTLTEVAQRRRSGRRAQLAGSRGKRPS